MCGSAGGANRTLALTAENAKQTDDSSTLQIWSVTEAEPLVPPIRKFITWDGIAIRMDVDTGSPVCIIPRAAYEAHRDRWPRLQNAKLKLSCYLGKLPVLGVLAMKASYMSVEVDCTLTVLDCEGPSLCGRDLLQKLAAEGTPVLHVMTLPSGISQREPAGAGAIMEEYADVFTEGLGLSKGPPARLCVKDAATPRFCNARKIPFALVDKVSAELDRLVETGVISPVHYAEWATPIVPVLKRDGAVRICGDFKVTLNPVCVGKVPSTGHRRHLRKLAWGTAIQYSGFARCLQPDCPGRKLAEAGRHKHT